MARIKVPMGMAHGRMVCGKGAWVFVVVVLGVLGTAIVAPAQICSFSYPSFTSTSGLTLSGDAVPVTTVDGNAVQVAHAATFLSGAVAANSRVPIAAFSTQWTFRITNPGGISDPTGQVGGDGFALSIAPNAVAYPGTDWFRFWEVGDQRFNVFLDTFENAGDVSSNSVHIGTASTLLSAANVPGQFDDGQLWTAWADYDGNHFELRLAHGTTRPSLPAATADVDLVGMVGQADAFVSLGALCGSAWGVHVLNSWTWTGQTVGIRQQPASAIACVTGTAPFSVVATGAGTFSYQWQIETAPGVWQGLGNDPIPLPCGGSALAFASPINSPNVTVGIHPCSGNPTLPQRFQVRAIVTNSGGCGSVTSNAATYSICPADFNCSGSVTIQDIFDFLAAWFAGNPAADFNGVNGIGIQDIFDFLAAWFAGCP